MQKEENTPGNTLKGFIKDWLTSIILGLVLAVIVMQYVVFVATVPTGSMQPTIEVGSKIIVWKVLRYVDWDTRGLSSGDIVVFKPNELNGFQKPIMLVKRVIGVGGDTITIVDGRVYVNGAELQGKQGDSSTVPDMQELQVPKQEFFVLGDNRGNSFDSRYWDKKTITVDQVIGEVTELK